MVLAFLFHFSGDSQEVTVLYLAKDKGFLLEWKKGKDRA